MKAASGETRVAEERTGPEPGPCRDRGRFGPYRTGTRGDRGVPAEVPDRPGHRAGGPVEQQGRRASADDVPRGWPRARVGLVLHLGR
ncbi:hypothetical protein ACWEN3_46865 [Streptomyces sp. NPDC004561]